MFIFASSVMWNNGCKAKTFKSELDGVESSDSNDSHVYLYLLFHKLSSRLPSHDSHQKNFFAKINYKLYL